MDSEPLTFAGFNLLERTLLTAMGALAVGVAVVLLRSAGRYRTNPTLGRWDAAALAAAGVGFIGFGFWIAFFAWFGSNLSIHDGILRCGAPDNAHRLAAFREARSETYRSTSYRRSFIPAGQVHLARIALIAPDGSRVYCDTFLKPDDPTTAALLSTIRARLGR